MMMVNLLTAGVVVGGVLAARNASDQGEDALVALVDDVTRASQAQAAAERMLVVGRGYLLTEEPEFLARAQAADAKLTRTIRTIVASARASDDPHELGALVARLKHYREAFSALLSGKTSIREPREVAGALKKQLIPARDELVVALDRFAARRREQLELRRSAARLRRAATSNVMLVIGGVGGSVSIALALLVARRTRDPIPAQPAALASPGGKDPPVIHG